MLLKALRNTPVRTGLLALVLAAISSLAAITGPAAHESGSEAYSIEPLTLHFGPGPRYPVAGSLPEAVEVIVTRCEYRWCLVNSGNTRGWTSIDSLTFGVYPRGPLSGPKLFRESYGSGTICFHTGPDFTGESVCSRTGKVVPDLALYGYDNVFASVSVHGEISAHVCREFNFGSYCETIIEDQPRLSRYLNRQVSSYRVW